MYRLLALDVDGTLLNSQGELTAPVMDALQRVCRRGVEIVIVSGRNIQGVTQVVNQLGMDLWFISSGGALITDLRREKILGRWLINNQDAGVLVGVARQGGAGIFLETDNRLYWEGPAAYLSWLTSVVGIRIDRVDDLFPILTEDLLKITLIMENEGLKLIEQDLRERQLSLNVTYSHPNYLEITAAGVTKGVALRRMAEFLGIPLKQVMAVGDGENDMSMFEVAGLGLAMGNAPEVVRRAADWVVPTNDEDGLVAAIRLLEESIESHHA